MHRHVVLDKNNVQTDAAHVKDIKSGGNAVMDFCFGLIRNIGWFEIRQDCYLWTQLDRFPQDQ